jgi:hypothetical protein
MKTKIFGGIAIVAIAAAVALNVSMSNQKQGVASKLTLANIEASAQFELPPTTNDGVIGINSYCEEVITVHNNPFDPEETIQVLQAGHSTDCLLGWPNWGCDDHGCELNTWSN